MNGYWHFSALAAGASALIIINGNLWFIFGYFIWLAYLYLFRGLNWLPVLCASISFLFFIFYIPTVETTPTSISAEQESQHAFTGIIDTPIKETPTYIQFVLKDQSGEKMAVYHFKQYSSSSLSDINAEYGQSCQIKGKMERPNPATNPGQLDRKSVV